MTNHHIDRNDPTKCICGERIGHAPIRVPRSPKPRTAHGELEYPLGICATPKCGRPAAWLSIPEGNVLGSTAPRRCTVCCDAIGAALETLLTKFALIPIPPQKGPDSTETIKARLDAAAPLDRG